ncbi:MAG: Ig-like domain-containing protein [Bacillota bacterium]|nr:Ig-like domain-containing protein [Bacillota bacterium]
MKKAVKKIFSLILTAAIIVSLFPVLATPVYANSLTVSNLNDSGSGSLRDVITNAAAGDVIGFQSGLNGTIVLSSQLIINKDLTIKGPGAANLTISGNNQCRAFLVTGGNVFISDLTIANGKAVGNSGGTGGDGHYGGGGGGGGSAGGGGGLLIKGGMAIISSVTFSGNTAVGGTGGTGGYAYLTGGDGPGGAGGASDLLDGSKGGEADFIGNGGPYQHDGFRYGGGGGGYGGYSGYPSGSSGGDGGAYIQQSGGLGGHGGAYYLSAGDVKSGVLGGNGGYGGNGLGGAACLMSGSLKMGNCTFSGNSATGGTGGQGGRSNFGFVEIVFGDGKPSMSGYYYGGTGGGGGEGMGGAVYVSEYSDSSSIENCTFSGNSANGGTGGAPADGITDSLGFEDFSKAGPPSMGGSIGGSFCADICSYASRSTGIRNLKGTGNNTTNGTYEIPGPNAGESRVTTSTYSLTADGTSTATIYVNLCDAGRLPIFGDPLVLEQNTGNSVISPTGATTDINGNATFTVKCATPGSETYTVRDTAYNMTVGQVTLDYLPPAPYKCTVAANPSSVTANGSDSSTISVTLKDENGCIVRGKTVVLDQGSGNSNISPASGITDGNGTAKFTITDANVEKVTYTATDTTDNVTVVQTASVDFTIGLPDAGKSVVTAGKTSAAANGTDSSNITVVLKDPIGHPVSGKTVTLDQGAGHSRISPAAAVTDISGTAIFTVTDTYAEKVTYTAKDTTDNNITLTNNVSITYNQSDWIVNTLNDDGSLGTLRYAIDNAPPGTTINFDSGLNGKITLSGQLPVINKNLTIDGTGASITISGNNYRVFKVDGGTVSLKNLTIADGRAVGGDGYGGGLWVTNGTVSVNNITFNNNGACGAGGSNNFYGSGANGYSGFGGAVAVSGGILTITGSEFDSNFANGGGGGGSYGGYEYTGGNGGNGNGGGIYVSSGTVTISSCNFDNNSANGSNGGTGYTGGNGGSSFGGAVAMSSGSLTINDTQFNGNSVNAGNGASGVNNGSGGSGSYKDIYIKNGIVSVNNSTFDPGDNIYLNPAKADAGTSIITAGPDNTPADGTAAITIKVTLKDANGGQLGNGKTVTLKSSSNGSNIVPVNNGLTDSSGTATFTATETNSGAVTYTAVDTTDNVTLSQTAAVTFKSFDWMVTSTNDSGFGTLRYAVQNAPSGATITFDDGLSGPIILQSPLSAINKDLTIDGTGADVTISGNSNRVFEVDGGSVTIKNLTIANSAAYGSGGSPTVNGGDAKGGGILIMDGTVSIKNVIFNNNIASGGSGVWDQWRYADGGSAYGGAIFINNGSLTITNSQFINCSANGGNGGIAQSPHSYDRGGRGGSGYGGAIYNNSGSLTITDSQFNGDNTVGGKRGADPGSNGGGYGTDIYNQSGVITLSNVTLDPGSSYYNESPADAGHSTVTAGPSGVLSDGAASSSVIVTIKDSNGSPLAGKSVTLSQGTGSSSIMPSTEAITDISGRVIFTVSDTKAEKVSYTAMDTTDNFTVTQTATVTFLPPDAEQSAITASQTSVTADGCDKSTITVTLKYSDGTPAAGKKVMLSQGAGSSNISPSAGAITDNNGTAILTVTDAKAEQVTYTAVDSTDDIKVTQQVAVTFNAYDWVVSGLSDDNTPGTLRYAVQYAPTGTEITFKADLKGTITLESPLPVINKDLTIDASGASVTINGDNKYRVFEVDSGTVCIKGITVANGKAVGSDGSKGLDSTSYAYNGDNGIACGGGGLLITDGTVSIDNVIFKDNSAIGGSGGNGGNGDVNGGNGGSGGDSNGGAVFVDSGSLSITNSTFTGNKSIGGAGGDGGYGNVYYGGKGGNGGNGYGGAIFVGSGSLTITNSTFDTNTVTGGSNGKGGNGCRILCNGSNGNPGNAVALDLYSKEGIVIINNVTFEPGNNSFYNSCPGNSGQSTITSGKASVLSDGVNSSTITVIIKDANGCPVPGRSVTLSQGTGSSGISPSDTAFTDICGIAVFTVADKKAEQVTYSAIDTTDNVTVTQTATVNFLPPDAGQSTVTSDMTSVTADGNDKVTITVTLKYTDGSPATGKTIILDPINGRSNISPASVITDQNGMATFSVTDNKTEIVEYFIEDSTDNIRLTQKAVITFNSYDWQVYSLNDDTSPGTLRYAVQNAPAGTTITFRSNLNGSITLQSPLPAINNDLTIDGLGTNVTISGGYRFPIFKVDGGSVSIKNLTLTDGFYGNYYGGEVDFNGCALLVMNGTVSVNNVTFSDNNATGGEGYSGTGDNGGNGKGGAIYINDGSLSIINSTFTGNSANGGWGGYGEYSETGGNGGNGEGGAIYINNGSVIVKNSMFSGNSATGGGGGEGGYGMYSNGGNGGNGGNGNGGTIFADSGSLTVIDCTFDGNAVTGGSNGMGGSYNYLFGGLHNGSPGSTGNARAVDFYNNSGTVTMSKVTLDPGSNSYYNLTSGCIVTFDSQGGSPVPGIGESPNSKVNQPTAPTRTGYTFDGWFKESSCTNKWDFSTDTVSDNITLYAKWSAITYTVSVSAKPSATGSVTGGGKYIYGDSVIVKAVPKSGYIFTDWTENGTEVSINSEYTFTMDAADRTLVANFSSITYTIADINDQTLATLIEGYSSNTQKANTITVTRTGSGELEDLKTELGGTDADSFVITQPDKTTLDSVNPATTFTVKAKDGLIAGTYNAAVTITADNMTPVTFNVTLTVRTGVSATLSTANASFDKNPAKQADVNTSITWNDVGSVTDIKAGGTSIGAGNFTVSGNTLTIKHGYLASLAPGDLELTVEFDSGSTSVLTISIADTTPPVISPSVKSYDLNSPSDVSTDITWYSAKSVTDVVYGSDSLTANDFTITGSTLTIMNSYLASRNCSEGDTLKFDIMFDTGDTSSLTVNVVNNYVKSPDAALSDLKVGGTTVNGFDPGVYTYDVELPYNTPYNSPSAAIEAVVSDSHSSRDITPVAGLPGTATVVVTAEDSTTITYTINFTLAADNAPSLKAGVATAANASVTVNSAFNLNLSTIFEDTDNDTLTYLVSIDGVAPASADQNFTYTPTSAGSTVLEFKANDGTLDSTDTYTVTLTAARQGGGSGNSGGGNSGSGNGGGGGPGAPVVTPPAETNNSQTIVSGNTITSTATTDNSGKASTTVPQQQMSSAIDNAVSIAENQGQGTVAKVEIKVQAPDNAAAVETSIPAEAVNKAVDNGIQAITVTTPVAVITFDDKALSTISTEATGTVKITASKGDASALPAETQQLVGDRPVFNFSVTSGDKTISQFGGNVSVTVPYTPKAGEDLNAIVIYYVNSEGKPELVSNCRYDPSTGSITFGTSHFSKYAVGYNKVTFKDVSAKAWYNDAVDYMAARGITTDTVNGNYSPDAKITRGEFIYMLMKAYGIAPDEKPVNNFKDAGNTYYTAYLSAAKRLGICGGVGNNMFMPDRQINRQEMFTLLYNALKVIGKLPAGTGGKPLSAFSDSNGIATWARDAMKLFTETGTISGSSGKLTPAASATKAQAAQILYNLLVK